uniref:Septin-type G domain-containing protein n=1 Tax=Nomascus leucogenys TaxID=61853 RepID=A0A2I3HPI5_NOMLE
MLICTNMEDLREQTLTRHYELYRRCKLEEMGFTDVGPENKLVSLQETYEAKRREFHGERQRKEEEMKQMFVEKEAILKEAKFEHLKRLHQEERMKLDEKRRLLEEEIIAFSKKKATSEIFHSQSFLATGRTMTVRTPIFCKTEVPEHRRSSSQANFIKKKKLEMCFDFAVFICFITSIFGERPQLLIFVEKYFQVQGQYVSQSE